MTDRQQLEQAIAALEAQRQSLGNAVVDPSIAALKEKLAALHSDTQQRKLATILFMDIAGHTELVRDLDPEDQLSLIDPILKRTAGVVEKHGGHIARFQGDGFKAVFGLPTAQENDPDSAVRAGLGILAEADRIADELKSSRGIERFQVRVGIDTGLVTSGSDAETEGKDTIKGSCVNLAARLESSAVPGTLVISHHTYQHVRGAFTLERLEPVQAKGFPEPVPAYRVLSERLRSFRTRRHGVEHVETRMIGRDRELDLLQEIHAEVLSEGVRQAVTIVGEAGVGKSRLLYEFENWVDLEPDTIFLYRGRGYPEAQRLPFSLLRSIFDFRFDLRSDDSAATVREKWLAGFEAGFAGSVRLEDQKLEMEANVLGHLLGVLFPDSPHLTPILKDPQQILNRSILYLLGYFQAVARRSPVMILLEDLHWADDGSLEVLHQLAIRLKDAPVLMVAAARPGLYERRPHWFEGWDFHRRIDLQPLSRKTCRALVAEVLQKLPEVPKDLEDLIVSQAEGNPFYVEELVKMLIEAGVVAASEEDWRVDAERLAALDVPATLTGVLQARLDRLPQDERILLQQASVVGRIFWDQALKYLNHERAELNEQAIARELTRLRGRELIFQREYSTFSDACEFIFKHALLRDVTYGSVLKRLRRIYHAQAAEWLQEQRGERSVEVTGLIAEHLDLAGRREEALRFLVWAGEEAAVKFANQEAIHYFSRALELIPADDLEQQYHLLFSREAVLNLMAQREPQRRDLETLEKLAGTIGDVERQMQVGVRWSEYYFITEHFQAAASAAEKALELGTITGSRYHRAHGAHSLGRAFILLNEHKKSRHHLDLALTMFREIGDKFWEGRTLRSLSLLSLYEHNYVASRLFSELARKTAFEVNDHENFAEATNHLGYILHRMGFYEAAKTTMMEYLALAKNRGSRVQEMYGLQGLGWLFLSIREFDQAYGFYEEAIRLAREVVVVDRMPQLFARYGWAAHGRKDWETALQAAEQALQLIAVDEAKTELNWAMGVLAEGCIAKTHWASGNHNTAEKIMEELLTLFQENGKSILWVLYGLDVVILFIEWLHQHHDARIVWVLDRAVQLIDEAAANISDPELRNSFLTNRLDVREILAWRNRLQGDAPAA